MERIRHRNSCENALIQCREAMRKLEGSEETLRHIHRVEESLKKLIAEMALNISGN